MKKISRTIISITATFVLVFSFAGTVYALGDYTPLAPLPGTTNTDNKTNLETYIPNAFKLSIAVAAVMAFVMITFGGITYATSDAITGKAQGREFLENAIWGLVLVIGAWIILNTINPKILHFDLSIPKPNVATSTDKTLVAGTPMTAEEIAADTTVRSRLAKDGVTVNTTTPCTQGQTRGCSNLNGLPEGAIQALISLKKDCKCGGIVITGGTEGGHASHGPGKGVVDLDPSPGLNSFLGVTSPKDGQVVFKDLSSGRRVGFHYETAGGNPNGTSTGNHWHTVLN